jgi:hypothetical protein
MVEHHPELEALYDKAMSRSFTMLKDVIRGGKAYTHLRYWVDETVGFRVAPVDVRQPRNPRARALIDAVVSLILH